MRQIKERESWASQIGFILASAGSAIGLGNIWRFPYVTGTNGGAAFILIYLIAILLIGVPIMITEMSMGRKTNRNPVGAFKSLASKTPWWLVGALGVFTGFVILSYYSVVAGWSLSYIFKALRGVFTPGAEMGAVFEGHITSPGISIFWHAVFMILTISIISAGVVKGIQRWVKILMPVLFGILIILVIRSVTLPGAAEGLNFYLSPNFGDITAQSLLDAIAQAFFTLSLGMGAVITYGSYLRDKDTIADNAGWVVGLDTFVAIIAGFAIFPAVFAFDLAPETGPGLTFITLPGVFAEMPFGEFFGFMFFLLLSIAALTSAISLLEVVTAYMIDEHQWPRKKAAMIIGAIIFVMGIPPVLGYSTLSEISFLGMDILDTYDWFANSIFLPLGGLLTAIFAGYVWGARNLAEEANKNKGKINVGKWYEILIKYIVPVAIG
ncbi:MAG: sodium-dependent transporter, partial [Bacillota bacterium]